jgi:hypothetical protein
MRELPILAINVLVTFAKRARHGRRLVRILARNKI